MSSKFKTAKQICALDAVLTELISEGLLIGQPCAFSVGIMPLTGALHNGHVAEICMCLFIHVTQ